jgi:hypothetical protein
MASTHNLGGNYWGYLIDQDFIATPLLTQLCLGLAKIIVGHLHTALRSDDADFSQSQLEPGPDTELTPKRLSAFYRSVGGNDFVFRELGHLGLSFMYKTLGCFHSIQPTESPFVPPSVPCLLPAGFVRWQTLQLLLHPDEHAQCMQKAVELYDVPKPGGGIFPKTIPRESFPMKPSEKMEKWHNNILERLKEDQQKLKNSPYSSPYEGPDRGDYVLHGSPHIRRTSRPPRTENQDLPHRLSASERRRSSVPSMPSPIHPPKESDNYHWASDQAYSAPNSPVPQSPRHRPSHPTASQRPPSQSYHRTSNSHNTTTVNNSAKSFGITLENLRIPFFSSAFGSKKNRDRSSTPTARDRTRHQRSPRSEAVSTGSEASSEDSLPRNSRYGRDRRRSSLAPPMDYDRSRRHSYDPSSLPPPKYMAAYPPAAQRGQNDHSYNHHPYPPSTAPIPNTFREDLFANGHGAASAPELPNGPQLNPRLRFIDPAGRDQSGERGRERRYNGGATLLERRAVSADRRSRSNDARVGGHSRDRTHGGDQDRPNMRRDGRPLRVNTVAGIGSKRVRTPEVRSAGMSSARRVPAMGLSGGRRR